MPCWIAIKHHVCPREKEVRVLLDISVSDRLIAYAVAELYQGRFVGLLHGLPLRDTQDQDGAWELAEMLCEFPGRQQISANWRDVLERLQRGRYYPHWPPQRLAMLESSSWQQLTWKHSPAAYASRFFEVGTWNWIASMVRERQQKEGNPREAQDG